MAKPVLSEPAVLTIPSSELRGAFYWQDEKCFLISAARDGVYRVDTKPLRVTGKILELEQLDYVVDVFGDQVAVVSGGSFKIIKLHTRKIFFDSGCESRAGGFCAFGQGFWFVDTTTGEVRFFDRKLSEIAKYSRPSDLLGQPHSAFMALDKRFMVVCYDPFFNDEGVLLIREIKTGVEKRFTTTDWQYFSVSSDEKTMACLSHELTDVLFYDIGAKSVKKRVSTGLTSLSRLRFLKSGLLAFGGRDAKDNSIVGVINPASGRILTSRAVPDGEYLVKMSVSSDGDYLAGTAFENRIFVWRLR